MRTRIALLSIAGLMASFAQAGPVDPSAITTFQPGTPAKAAEVNANFQALITAIDDNATQIAASGQELAIEVDCGDVREALQQAIDGSDPTKPLRINVIGTASCGPIAITRDHVNIIGGTDADPTPRTIGTNAENSVPVWVEGARHVVLSRMTIDAADGGSAGAAAAVGVAVAKGALATLDFISVQNSTGEAVTVFVNSTAILSGNNTINGGSEVALNIGGNATVFAENGLTTIESTGGACVLEMDANAVLGGPAGLDISGNCAEISGNSYLGMENGSITIVPGNGNGKLEVINSLALFETSEGNIQLDVDQISALGNGRVVIDDDGPGSITHAGTFLIVGGGAVVTVRGSATVAASPSSGLPNRILALYDGGFSADEHAGQGDGPTIQASLILADYRSSVVMGVNMQPLATGTIISVQNGSFYQSEDPTFQADASVFCGEIIANANTGLPLTGNALGAGSAFVLVPNVGAPATVTDLCPAP